MLAASVAVEKSLAELTPPYLKQQANRGVDRKSALRKLAKKRLIWEKAILAARACREGWENGVACFEGVQKECLGAAAPFVGCDTEGPVDVSHAQAGKLMVQALALKGTYQKLLHGWPRSTAFEEMAELLGVGVTTIETWERAYRNTGHM
ncbi:unnamed protein product, partial [Ascophyllum nodosum]